MAKKHAATHHVNIQITLFVPDGQFKWGHDSSIKRETVKLPSVVVQPSIHKLYSSYSVMRAGACSS